MSAQLYNLDRTGTTLNETRAANQAREFQRARPPKYVRGQLVWAIIALLGAALLDLGLMYQIQVGQFMDELGNFTGSSLALWSVACMSLAWFFLIGYLWNKDAAQWRVLAGIAYGLLLVLITAFLKTTYENLFTNLWIGGSNPFIVASAPEAPAWFRLIGVGLISVFYTVGGILFLLAKDHLVACLAIHRQSDECTTHVAQDEEITRITEELESLTSTKAFLSNPVNAKAMISQAVALARDTVQTDLNRQKDAAHTILSDIRMTKEHREQAGAKISAIEACTASLRAISLSLLLLLMGTGVLPNPVHAATTAAMLEAAPTFQLIIDVSPSPGINIEFLRSTWPGVEQRLRSMPLGSSIIVQSAGAASLHPLVFRSRIQVRHTSEGDTMDSIVRGVRELLFSFPERFKDNPHQQSELIGAFFDASRNINQKTSGNLNVIVAVSDLIENSSLLSFPACWNKKSKSCTLPAPNFSLHNSAVYVWGVGQGLSSDHAMKLTKNWEVFLKKTGATVVELRRG